MQSNYTSDIDTFNLYYTLEIYLQENLKCKLKGENVEFYNYSHVLKEEIVGTGSVY